MGIATPRRTLIAATLLAWSAICFLFVQMGYERTWHLWGVPTLMPVFVDFRLIPGTAETVSLGLDPSVENPGDPLNRLFNYPKAWYLFFYTGVAQDSTVPVVIAGLVLFFTGVCAFPGRMLISDVPLLLGIAFSPAAMLLYERGNVDIFIFVLCVAIVMTSASRPTLSLALIVMGAFLKIYPLVAVVVFLKESLRRFRVFVAIAAGAFLLYFTWFDRSLRAAWALTQRGSDLSYGANVITAHYGLESTGGLGIVLICVPYLAALVVGAGGLVYGIRQRDTPVIEDQRNLDAFRIGAAIYVGTFVLGNNWDYRLAFLVFIVPQLTSWIRASAGMIRNVSIAALILCYVCCWYFFFGVVAAKLHLVLVSHEFLFGLDQASNWTLFALLLCLLVISAPDWLKAPLISRRTLAPRDLTTSDLIA